MNLHAKHITARISMHTQCLFVWLQGHLHTQRALTPPPSSSVIGLLWDRAARWQIWIQGNRKGGMDRGGGAKERGAVHYFVPSLSLSLSLCRVRMERLTQAGEETCHERWWHSHGDTATSSLSPKFAACCCFCHCRRCCCFCIPQRRERAKDSWHSLPPHSHFSLSSSLFHFCLWMMGF